MESKGARQGIALILMRKQNRSAKDEGGQVV